MIPLYRITKCAVLALLIMVVFNIGAAETPRKPAQSTVMGRVVGEMIAVEPDSNTWDTIVEDCLKAWKKDSYANGSYSTCETKFDTGLIDPKIVWGDPKAGDNDLYTSSYNGVSIKINPKGKGAILGIHTASFYFYGNSVQISVSPTVEASSPKARSVLESLVAFVRQKRPLVAGIRLN